MFWYVVTKTSEIAYYFGPWILLVATALWALRARSWPSYCGLLAGTLVAGAKFAHMTATEVRSIGLGGLQPLVDQNPVVYFFYMHGMSFGMFLLAIALAAQYARRGSVA